MKRVYRSDDFLLVGHLRGILEANHVPCIVRNELLIGAAGELPPSECWPELWVTDDADQERARALVEAYLDAGENAGPEWRCAGCGEPIEGQFTACWRCGEERPPGEDP
jgi:hypothetical protein